MTAPEANEAFRDVYRYDLLELGETVAAGRRQRLTPDTACTVVDDPRIMRSSVVSMVLAAASLFLGCTETPDTSSAWLTVERAFSGLMAGNDDAEHYFAEDSHSRRTA